MRRSEPKAIPVVVPITEDYVLRLKLQETQAAMAALVARDNERATQCSEFLKTGHHNLVADAEPTFFCGSDPWAGLIRHCAGTAINVTSLGQFTVRCPEFLIPGQRRGSTGRKRVMYR